MIHSKGLFKNYSFLLIEKFVALGTNLFIVLLFPLYLNYQEFGKFITALSISSVCWFLVNLGFDVKVIKELASGKISHSNLISQVVVLKLFLSLLVIGISFLILHFSNYSPDLLGCIYILLLSILFMNFAETFQAGFKGFEKMQYSSAIITITDILLIFLFIFVLKRGGGIISIAIVFLICRILYFLLSSFIFHQRHKYHFEFQINNSVKILYDSITRIPAQYFLSNLFNQGVILISIFHPSEAGNFGLAAKIMGAIYFILTGFCEAALPIMSRNAFLNINVIRANFIYIMKILVIILLFLIFLTSVFTKLLIKYFWGMEYWNAYYYVLIFLIAFPFLIILTLFQYFLTSLDKQKRYFMLLLIIFTGNILLSIAGFAIGGLYGIIGAIPFIAIVSTLISYKVFYKSVFRDTMFSKV